VFESNDLIDISCGTLRIESNRWW